MTLFGLCSGRVTILFGLWLWAAGFGILPAHAVFLATGLEEWGGAVDASRNVHNPHTSSYWQNVAVFGKDERQSVPKRYEPLAKAIGLLHNPRTNTLCTAFCVAPDVIATAAHCFFTPGKKTGLALSEFIFRLRAGPNGAQSHVKLAGHERQMARHYILAGTSRLNRRPPIGAAKDWALARLSRPACQANQISLATPSPKVIEKAAQQGRIFQLAYHMDFKNWRLAYSRPCEVKRNFGKLRWKTIRKQFSQAQSLLLHRCDTGGASSGSPLFMETPQGPVAVAINVGTYQQRNLYIRNGRVIRRSQYRSVANTAVTAASFAPLVAHLRQAQILNSRETIERLQRHLQTLGLYLEAIDGILGSRTEAAIKTMEKRLKWPVTGLPTHKLLLELERSADTGRTTMSAAKATPRVPETPYPKTKSVKQAQTSQPRKTRDEEEGQGPRFGLPAWLFFLGRP